MDRNERVYQFFTSTSSLNFFLKFCTDDLLIIDIIFTKFHKTIHPFNHLNKRNCEKLDENSDGEDLNPYIF